MEVTTERTGSAVILHLKGRLTAEAETDRLQAVVDLVSSLGPGHVLLDLGGIRQLDCSGIGQLLRLRAQFHKARRTLALVDVERHQQRMLKRSGLLGVFRVFRSREEALATLGIGTDPVRVPCFVPARPLRGAADMHASAYWDRPASWAAAGGL